MRTVARIAVGVVVWSIAGHGSAAAQHWDTPTFYAPRPADDIGLYVTKADAFDDVGLVGIWRQTGNIDLGVRAGLASVAQDERGVLVGAELMGPLALFPNTTVLLHWTAGAGAVFNEITMLRIPVGASVGLDLERSTGLRMLPYVHPRAAIDIFLIGEGDAETTQTELHFDIDVGAELAIGDAFLLRAAATIGDFDTVGVGLAYHIPRQVSVR